MSKGTQSTLDFLNGFTVTNTGAKITVDGSGFVRTTTDQSIAGNKTFTGNTTLANTTVSNGSTVAVGNSSNTLTTQTAAQVNTGNGLTSGQALTVNTGSSTFTTGAGTGFFYGGATDSLSGATTIKSTGDFSGTLVALTADRTTAGTVLGISAQNLTTGKAIDVSLGTLYSGTTDAQGTIGAVNVRAQSFTGNVFNVSASGAGSATANLANFQSTQLAGQVLNVNATSLTTGKAIAVTLGTAGTGIYLNTAAGYTGNLVQLRMNGNDRLVVDQAGNTTLGGTLTVLGASITGPASGAFSIDNGNASLMNIGGTNATTLNLGRATQTQALLGNATVAGTLGVTGATTLSSTLGVTGNTTLSGTLTGPGASPFAIDSGGANNINIGGTNATTLNLGRATQTQALLGNATVAGTLNAAGNFSVNTTKLVVNATTGAITGPNTGAFALDNGNASGITIGAATATTVTIGRTGQTQALAGDVTVAGTLTGPAAGTFTVDNGSAAAISIGGTTATTLNLGRSGQTQALAGNVTVAGTLTGPAAGTFTVDNGSAAAISIGGTTATTLNLGRSGQTQALLGNGTVAGTFTVGNGSGNDYLAFTEEATNPTCAAGDYRVWANSTDLKLKKCQNGVITDLDTTAATGTWTKLFQGSLIAAAPNLDTGVFAAKKHLHVVIRISGYSGASIARLEFNGDTGGNYSQASSENGGAATTRTGDGDLRVAGSSTTGPRTLDIYIRNVATQAKVVIIEGASVSESAGTAPTINSTRGVWANTTAQITRINIDAGGVNLLTGTEIVVWGRDDD